MKRKSQPSKGQGVGRGTPEAGKRPIGLPADVNRATLTGLRYALCTACGEAFSTPGNFDKHQTQRGDSVKCHPPAKRSLVQRADGVWVGEGSWKPEAA